MKNNKEIKEKKEKPAKKKVEVINVPHKKKKLRTPSHIIRLCIVWAYLLCIFMLTFPFLNARIFIADDLSTTMYSSEAHLKLATQEEIDAAESELQSALDNLKEKDTKKADEKTPDFSRSLDSASYKWEYNVSDKTDSKALQALIEKAMQTDRDKYTGQSVKALNTATLKAQKTLCATVQISQTAFQMMLGGTVGESYGHADASADISRSLFSFALGILPLVGFFAASFDKHRHIKHIIGFICSMLSLGVIIFTIYPYLGIGAVLSILIYFLLCALHVGGIYAKQQEDYIVKHPEKEAEFSEKHPQLVKALINEKAFGDSIHQPTKSEKELESAKNAQKRRKKKKRS